MRKRHWENAESHVATDTGEVPGDHFSRVPETPWTSTVTERNEPKLPDPGGRDA
ncbi:hypothetical protein PM082_018296 [Marasmius tenuissimus]|nr:hypothetical protein PM082_018296 [Marasmius tenuissimus]